MLSDREIYDAMKAGDIRLENAGIQDGDFGKDAPVQPASLDLHVGEIFLPPPRRQGVLRSLFSQESRASPRGRVEYDLKQGETAFIRTREKIKLSSSISAFGFPPTEVSTAGVLMTNPGHVDPGYEGFLHFTIVNMGREPFVLRAGHRVVTLLFVKLANVAASDYAARRNGTVSPLQISAALRPLSQDFLDLERRSADIAVRKIRDAELGIKYGTPILVAVITALGTLGAGFFLGLFDVVKQPEHARLVERIDALEGLVSKQEFDARLDRLENVIQPSQENRSEGGEADAN
jgi:dCTP deaminase